MAKNIKMQKLKFKLSLKQKQAIKKLAKEFKLKLIIAFGSQVSGRLHSNSDMDIAVLPIHNGFSFKLYTDLLRDFSRIFSDKEIDLSFINRADPLFLSNICKNPFLLYGKKRNLDELRIYSFKRYIDYQPYFKVESNFVDKFIMGVLNAS